MDIGRLCLAAAAVQAWHSLGARQDVHFVPRAQACTTGPVLAACGLPLLHKQIRERMRVVGMSAWTQMSSRTHTHARTHTHTPVSQTKINMHTHTHTHTLTLSLSHSLTHSHTHTHTSVTNKDKHAHATILTFSVSHLAVQGKRVVPSVPQMPQSPVSTCASSQKLHGVWRTCAPDCTCSSWDGVTSYTQRR